MKKSWIKQVLIALDQLVNAIFGGWADETLSSRTWRHKDQPGWRLLRWILDTVAALFGDKNHCRASYVSEKNRTQCPPEVR